MPRTNHERYEQAVAELTQEAIAETEREIANDAFSDPPDENTGDTSLEQMDDEDVPEDGDEGDEAEDESEESEETDPERPSKDEGDEGEADEAAPEQDRRGIPPSRLREESEARRAAEAEREAERATVRALQAEVELLKRGGVRQQEQPNASTRAQQPEKPDMFADPEGWAKAQREEITREVNERRVNGSFGEAAEEHGEKFQAAFTALRQAGSTGDAQTVQRIIDAPNPGRALMRWHEQRQAFAEIGNDPAAYRQKVREELMRDPEVRKAVISGARGEALAKGRTRERLPPSLSDASGGTSHRGGFSRDTARTSRSEEQDIFDSAFED